MRADSILKRGAFAAVASTMLAAMAAPAFADDLPPYMQPIMGHTSVSAGEIATKNVLALNTGMFALWRCSQALSEEHSQ